MAVTLKGSGQVPVQIVTASTSTTTSTTSATPVATALTASITPTSSSNKILILVTGPIDTGTATNQTTIFIYRNSTTAVTNGNNNGFTQSQRSIFPAGIVVIDSPATTSSTTYTVFMSVGSSGNATFPQGGGNITLMEISG